MSLKFLANLIRQKKEEINELKMNELKLEQQGLLSMQEWVRYKTNPNSCQFFDWLYQKVPKQKNFQTSSNNDSQSFPRRPNFDVSLNIFTYVDST